MINTIIVHILRTSDPNYNDAHFRNDYFKIQWSTVYKSLIETNGAHFTNPNHNWLQTHEMMM